jgi:hypothetical protein
MTTPAEMIASVLSRFSRPDLEEEVTLRFPRALKSAHSVNDFRRDLATTYVYDPMVVAGIANISVSVNFPRLRKIKSISTYADFVTVELLTTPVGQHITSYKDRTLGEFTYYGFQHAQTWLLAGDVLNLSGVESPARVIGVYGVYYPTYVFNEFANEWETSSWLMIEYPDIVEAYLNLYVAQRIQNKDQIATYERELFRVRQELISTYEQELV